MPLDILIKNVALPGIEGLRDIGIASGRFAAIEPSLSSPSTLTLDAEGRMAMDRSADIATQLRWMGEAGLEDAVGVVDVVAEVAVALLHPARGEGLEAGVDEARVLALGDDAVVHVEGLLGGDVELVAELAEIGDADAEDLGVIRRLTAVALKLWRSGRWKMSSKRCGDKSLVLSVPLMRLPRCCPTKRRRMQLRSWTT